MKSTGFASDFFKTMEAAVAIAADSRLPAPGDHRRRQKREWAFSGFDGGFGCGVGAAASALHPRGGVFILNVSHVCLPRAGGLG